MMDSSLNKHVAKQLKHFRTLKGLTQVQLAEKAGVNPNAYAKIERGNREAKNSVLKKLAKALGVSSSDILPF